ncbi:putative integral membrane protein [Theileria parva strain Muguga]|uniref:Uncharacterized protein n=1 Tax=Theileria parva TaxID=5875 RepID=Q4N8S2_THEPA|nr:putative integral membrane protein [Theileria parva strain Muguga]EAN33636.1 putative integral membrane protein [Theileria parva strain Muguga]|eukprot:XP_765919.1 hypothetical protein [Theileria parva strain Muguga]
MSENRLNVKAFFSRKFFLLIYVLCMISVTQANGLKYNRGPLEESYQNNNPSANENDLDDMDDEFTGTTYLEPANDNNSFLENNEDYDEDEDDEEDYEEEDIDLDRFSDASLLEMESTSDEEDSNEGSGGNKLLNKINPKLMNGGFLKNYLDKIGESKAIKGIHPKKAIANVKTTMKDLQQGYKKLKGKVYPRHKTYEPKSPNHSNHGGRSVDNMSGSNENRNRGKTGYGRRFLNKLNGGDGAKPSRLSRIRSSLRSV